MKLRNKKTGEIVEVTHGRLLMNFEDGTVEKVKSLAELNAEWEDHEEPKSKIEDIRLNDMISGRHIVEIDFTKVEEAEKAVEKLKAWKRLEDKGFRFDGYNPDFEGRGIIYPNDYSDDWCWMEDKKDLDLLFGGEE